MTEIGGAETESRSINPFIKGLQKMIGIYEETPTELLQRHQKEARELAKALEKKKGGKALLLNLGHRAATTLGDDAIYRGSYYEEWNTFSREDLIGLYEEFRRISPDTKVAIGVSDFKPRKNSAITTPNDVVRQVVETSRANNWTVPKVVGAPAEKHNFDELKQEFPDIYLGDYNYEGRQIDYIEIHGKIFEAIEQDLPPSSVRLDRDKSREDILAEIEAKKQQKKEEEERRLSAYEASIEPKMYQEAEEAFRELETVNGERAVIIIVDDMREKIDRARQLLENHASQTGVSYVIRGVESGSDGIVLYLKFAQLAPTERVIILMDGFLKGILDRGIDVTRRLARKVQENNLSMPFLIGESSDKDMNEKLQKAYPEIYLGSFELSEREETLKSIRSKL